ncbi:matrixin family metalloprotease [Candidatus Kaiserbacteria bacterium]|nr:matrixin family metalloprotease [Candidatus Kaiserbacteria bacterium]MCB9811604.1 matrixin family metalloprotease [Candidatus Nomurabacteria bacterium]
MRTPYAVLFLVVLLVAGVYWYTLVGAACQAPVSYRIGTIDDRFALSPDEVRSVVNEAASIWENATDRNLFTYDDDGDVAINFVYDDRQQSADAAGELQGELNETEALNDELEKQYAALVASYEAKKESFAQRRNTYEQDLAAYNATVNSYNQNGGAPEEVYEELEETRLRLDRERQTINDLADELNDLSSKINELGEQGNEVIAEYNENVNRYNQQYGHSEEFTQGDYQGDSINIYTFKSREELELVLAHELGHALALDHVDNDKAIMYYLMGDQPTEHISLTDEDLAEFAAMCGEVTPTERWSRMRASFMTWLNEHFAL